MYAMKICYPLTKYLYSTDNVNARQAADYKSTKLEIIINK